MSEGYGAVLYDNMSEPGFARLRNRRRYRLVASISAILAGAVTVTVVFAPGSPHDAGGIMLWLVALSFMAMLLVGGFLVDVRRGLGIKVTSTGVRVPPRSWIPAELLKGARSEERLGFVVVRAHGNGGPLLSVEIRDIANPDRFKAALAALTGQH